MEKYTKKRIIKFRGKTYSGNWVYGDLALPPNRFDSIRENCFTTDIPKYEEHQVIPETVGQFTGLCDKNGKEIYEGDVVKGFCYNDFYTGIEGNVNAVVRWIDAYAGFVFDIDAQYFHDMRDARKIEIIGNVFDNKELLKGEQQ
ncbi:MAG: YopX family protein [Lactobacillus sp.]|nr:YopX family protein [Lactobacillus sp.]